MKVDWGNLRNSYLLIPIYPVMVVLCLLSWFLLYIDYSTTAMWYNSLPIRKVVSNEGMYAGLIPMAITIVFGYLAFNNPHRRRVYFTVSFIAWAIDAYADITYRVDVQAFGLGSLLAGIVIGGAVVTVCGEILATLTTAIVIDYFKDFVRMVMTAATGIGDVTFAVDGPMPPSDIGAPRPYSPPPAAKPSTPKQPQQPNKPGGPPPIPSAGPAPVQPPTGLGAGLIGSSKPESSMQPK